MRTCRGEPSVASFFLPPSPEGARREGDRLSCFVINRHHRRRNRHHRRRRCPHRRWPPRDLPENIGALMNKSCRDVPHRIISTWTREFTRRPVRRFSRTKERRRVTRRARRRRGCCVHRARPYLARVVGVLKGAWRGQDGARGQIPSIERTAA